MVSSLLRMPAKVLKPLFAGLLAAGLLISNLALADRDPATGSETGAEAGSETSTPSTPRLERIQATLLDANGRPIELPGSEPAGSSSSTLPEQSHSAAERPQSATPTESFLPQLPSVTHESPGTVPPVQLLEANTLPQFTPMTKADHSSDVVYSELLLIAESMAQAEKYRQQLVAHGLKIKRRTSLKGLGFVLSVFSVPPSEQQPENLLQALQKKYPDMKAEYNQRYYLQGASKAEPLQYARQQVGLLNTPKHQGQGVRLAMLDAAVDPLHPVFSNSVLTVKHISPDERVSRHGTAVASLMIGQGMVAGALPEAELLAVNIFQRNAKGKLETRSDWWLQGLDFIAQAQPLPQVVNISFGGGDSYLVQQAIKKLTTQMRFVAAAGNGGAQSKVLFPASMAEVVAVTAVDVNKVIYTQAPHSQKISMAAPGVDVWAADSNGKGFYATGTSFAAPWVSALLALGVLSGDEIKTQDLGAAGIDPVFGAGLIKI